MSRGTVKAVITDYLEKGTDTCTWPGCGAPGLCQSGNFGNQIVCSEHFMRTNGETGSWTDFSNNHPAEERLVVVVQLDGTCTVARRVYHPGDGTRGSAGWLWDIPGGDACHLEVLENPVTHWLPLPALPPGRQTVAEWRGPTMRKRAYGR